MEDAVSPLPLPSYRLSLGGPKPLQLFCFSIDTPYRHFSWAQKSLQMVTAAMKLRCVLLGRRVMTNLDSILKSRDITLLTNVHIVKVIVFPVIIWMWELNYKESWKLKNWYLRTVVLEKTPESPLDYKEIKPVNSKGNQSWIFIGRTDAEAETAILWLPDVKNWIIGKHPDARKDWRQEENGTTEDEMVGWHHWLDGHEFWAGSGSWWWTGKPGRLQSIGSKRVGHNWVTELNWTSNGRKGRGTKEFLDKGERGEWKRWLGTRH